MKVLVAVAMCMMAGGVASGAVTWPGALGLSVAPVVNTIVPAQTKGFSYSTTQYINSVPTSFAVPQFFGTPQLNAFSSSYFPIAGASFYPFGSLVYPSASHFASFAPITSGFPVQSAPSSPPSTPASAGDSETAIIDSAAFPTDQQNTPEPPKTPEDLQPQQPVSQPPQTETLPQTPQESQQTSFPQFPQLPQESQNPSYPQIPQFPQFPQLPQGSAPGFPQFPQLPSNPMFPSPSPPATFPGADSADKGLNDDDTISVESA